MATGYNQTDPIACLAQARAQGQIDLPPFQGSGHDPTIATGWIDNFEKGARKVGLANIHWPLAAVKLFSFYSLAAVWASTARGYTWENFRISFLSRFASISQQNSTPLQNLYLSNANTNSIIAPVFGGSVFAEDGGPAVISKYKAYMPRGSAVMANDSVIGSSVSESIKLLRDEVKAMQDTLSRSRKRGGNNEGDNLGGIRYCSNSHIIC